MAEATSTTPRPELIRRLITAVRRQVAWTVLHNQAIADRLGLAVTDLHCINLLELEGPMTAGRLAELLALTTGAVTGVLDRLERAGLVRREADPSDRRRVIARLVPEGMEKVRAAFAAVGSGAQVMYSRYDDGQLALLIDYAERSAELTRGLTTEMRSTSGLAATDTEGPASAPLAGVSSGRLEIVANISRVRIGTASGMAELYRASFERRMPRIRVSGGTVSLSFPGIWHTPGRGEVILNDAIPWAVEIRGGASNLEADLSGASLSELSLTGGASQVEFRLANPVGTVPLRIRGGASRVTIRRPTGAPVRVRVSGGLSKLRLDGRRPIPLGGTSVLDSPGYEGAVNRYELELSGGASRVDVETY